MNRKINVKKSANNFNRYPSLMQLSMSQSKEKNLKPVEEWIYGSLNITRNNRIINFKNQKAFNGYQKKRIDLYKSFYIFNIVILIL